MRLTKINRVASKISALSSGKINKYEYLTDEEILPFHQKHIIEQAKFTYSPLGKAFEKQTKTIKDEGEELVKPIKEHRKQLIKSNKGADNESHKSFDELCYKNE